MSWNVDEYGPLNEDLLLQIKYFLHCVLPQMHLLYITIEAETLGALTWRRVFQGILPNLSLDFFILYSLKQLYTV